MSNYRVCITKYKNIGETWTYNFWHPVNMAENSDQIMIQWTEPQ